jgi:hypothetical protein
MEFHAFFVRKSTAFFSHNLSTLDSHDTRSWGVCPRLYTQPPHFPGYPYPVSLAPVRPRLHRPRKVKFPSVSLSAQTLTLKTNKTIPPHIEIEIAIEIAIDPSDKLVKGQTMR